MEPFLLGINHLTSGITHVTYDIGPSRRANVATLSENISHLLDVPAGQLLGYTLAETRPPTVSRRHS